MLRRGRFDDVVRRQLDLFEVDEAGALADADAADAAWTNAEREEAEELYGDYQLVVDEIADRLWETRESYAQSLDEQTAGEYRRAFNRAATKRFRPFAAFLSEEQ